MIEAEIKLKLNYWNKKKSGNQCFVYGLYDTEDNLKYIGQTKKNPELRLHNHYGELKRRLKKNLKLPQVQYWLHLLAKENKFATLRILSSVATWNVTEVLLIERYTKAGVELLNVLRGGADTPDDLVRELTEAKLNNDPLANEVFSINPDINTYKLQR